MLKTITVAPTSVPISHCNAYKDYRNLAREVIRAEEDVEVRSGKDLFVDASGGVEAKDIIFTIDAPPEARVQIAGDFNSWKPEGLNYRNHFGKPAWQKLYSLTPGNYQWRLELHDEQDSKGTNNRVMCQWRDLIVT